MTPSPRMRETDSATVLVLAGVIGKHARERLLRYLEREKRNDLYLPSFCRSAMPLKQARNVCSRRELTFWASLLNGRKVPDALLQPGPPVAMVIGDHLPGDCPAVRIHPVRAAVRLL